MIKLTSLGQVGYIVDINNVRLVIDPYLSNYVEDKYGKQFKSLIKSPILPESIKNVDYILISHEHEDHCDPFTLGKIFEVNQDVKIICPRECNEIIKEIPFKEILNLKIQEKKQILDINIEVVPAAHPELEINNGYSRFMGFLISINNFVMYHAGDTIPFLTANNYLPKGIDLAFLPINERNFFKDSAGIIGNMTCREALEWVEQLKIKHWIPTHWDTFSNNGTYQEELDIVAKRINKSNYTWINAGETISI
ncbi:MBL fold metallo-hydrolase [Reichenbachiella sp.]|uniref:MBL fold metallo-hydrolase n=1 Tax=Reichenbachiella sp. TaxID=2184521 RepID=UPI003BB01A55